jgi:hypothetical protein
LVLLLLLLLLLLLGKQTPTHEGDENDFLFNDNAVITPALNITNRR